MARDTLERSFVVKLLVTLPAESAVRTPDRWDWEALVNPDEDDLVDPEDPKTPVILLSCEEETFES